MRTRVRRLPALALTLVAFGAGVQTLRDRPAPSPFRIEPSTPSTGEEARFATSFVSHRHDTAAHASALVELGDGRLRAFWFSGTREGAVDVQILTSTWDPAREAWGEESVAASPTSTRQGLWRHVTKLGNPAALRTSEGTLWLFYVTVTVGGWGGSTVSAVRSTDDGATWSPPVRLVGTPLMNFNTMVRGRPFELEDGTIGLPAYQSLIQGFSEVLRVDRAGAVIDKVRVSTLGQGSQPAMVVTSADDAVAFMRPSGRQPPRRVLVSTTQTAGQRWSTPEETSLVNPDAAVDGLGLPDGRVLLAVNDVDVERDALSLVVTDSRGGNVAHVARLEDQVADRTRDADDERYARIVQTLARATDSTVDDAARWVASSRLFMCWEPRCHFEYSYPTLLRTTTGEYHLLYTWHRAYIKHVRFNQAWLDQRLTEASGAPR